MGPAVWISIAISWALAEGRLFTPLPRPLDACNKLDTVPQFDFIVVGGGAAGAVVARRLSEVKGWRVLLLEAGGDAPIQYMVPLFAADPFRQRFHEWGILSHPSNQSCLNYKRNQCDYRRAKLLGGCTTNNFMMYVRGNPLDYNEWADLGNKGWSYDEVLPYFKKSELFLAYPITPEPGNSTVGAKFHSRNGPHTVNNFKQDPATKLLRNGLYEAAYEMGYERNIDYNGETQLGFTDYQSTIDVNGYRETTARSFLYKTPRNLLICKHTLVNTLILDGKTVQGVEVITKLKRRLKVLAKQEVILSGGAFGSPGILERSGIGNKDILKKLDISSVYHLPGVGENLQDHNYMTGNFYKTNSRSSAPKNILTNSLTSFGGFFNTFGNSTVPDIQMVFFAFANGDAYLYGKSLNFRESYTLKIAALNLYYEVLTVGPVILRPKSRGSAHIVDKDPESAPRVISNYYDNQEDVDTMTRGLRFMDKMLHTEAFRPFEPEYMPEEACSEHKLKSDKYYECAIRHFSGTLYHPSATCRMGPKNDKMAVVDERLRVHGIKNLRIADASIFPLIPRGNTQAPTIMIGEKAADMIKEDYGKAN